MPAHDLTREAWIARFREYFTEQVKLTPGTPETESLLEGELEVWIQPYDVLFLLPGQPAETRTYEEWQDTTPEDAVWENLSYWEP
jgi:hypothetical protein